MGRKTKRERERKRWLQCICNMNLCDLDLQGVCTIAPSFVTRHEAD